MNASPPPISELPVPEDRVGPGAVRRNGGASLWQQVLADLRRRLAAGEFAADFPGELELTQQYDVSRHTVREALRQLRAEGLVTATPGRRPRVRSGERVDPEIGIVHTLFNDAETPRQTQVRRLTVQADALIAVRLGLEESTPLLLLERLRLTGDRPLALDRVWFPATLTEPLRGRDFTDADLYAELAAIGLPVTGGTETVRAVIPSPSDHSALGLDYPAAALELQRLGTSGGRPVEWRRTVIRADRFSLATALTSSATVGSGERIGPVSLTLEPRYDG